MIKWDVKKSYQTAKVFLKKFQEKFPAKGNPPQLISLDQMQEEAELFKWIIKALKVEDSSALIFFESRLCLERMLACVQTNYGSESLLKA